MDHEAITLYLEQIEGGDRSAIDHLLPRIYDDLHALAKRAFYGQPAHHTLQPTALVNEAYLRLVGTSDQSFNDRRHFLAVAATAMRQLLTDHARGRETDKRGGRRNRVLLDDATPLAHLGEHVDLGALDEALTKLQQVHSRQARIVELRFLAGMGYEEIGREVDLAERTVRLDWKMARAWLRKELKASSD